MEIGPVTGVRAVSLLSVNRTDSAEIPVFEIDPSARADDETYSAARQTPSRGLEDEDSAATEEEDRELAPPPIQTKPGGGISYFA